MKRFFKLKLFSACIVSASLVVAACSEEKKDKKDGEEIASEQSDFNAKVIYGEDDRIDLYQVQDQRLLKLADSTVALLAKTDIRIVGDKAELVTMNYGNSYSPPLCTSERFREQDTAAFCSGFLVAPNIVATAGHCVRTSGSEFSDCETTAFVFGFGLNKSSDKPKSVAAKNVYTCKRIIKSVLTNNGADFSLVELDRPVEGHAPLKVRRSGVASVGDEFIVIGHPSGLPTKVAGGAIVRKVDKAFYVASLDTYGGNSGSAVFNSKTHEVEGILVRGEEDFVMNGNCQVSNRCTQTGCRGEDVTKITEAILDIPELPDDGADDPGNFPGNTFKSEPKLSIPDNTPAGISSSLFADQAPNGKPVKVEVNITHPWRGDLIVTIVAPDGTSVVLSNRQGRSLDHIIGVFGGDLEAPGLENLVKVKRAGEWKLKVSDRAARDAGVLNSWGLSW